MLRHSFSNFSYSVNHESAKKGYKEILVNYTYNGTKILRKVYVKEADRVNYINAAKGIVNNEIKSGYLAIYSNRYIKNKYKLEPKLAVPKKSKKKVAIGKINSALFCRLVAFLLQSAE